MRGPAGSGKIAAFEPAGRHAERVSASRVEQCGGWRSSHQVIFLPGRQALDFLREAQRREGAT
jgi:hypothetical protein